MIHATERIDPQRRIRTYNLGTAKGTSVLTMMGTMGNIVETFEWDYGLARPGDPSSLIANPYLYIQDTDFHYKHSDLRNIISSAWEHYIRDYHGI
jgi:UDP-glucose 4-epimerase